METDTDTDSLQSTRNTIFNLAAQHSQPQSLRTLPTVAAAAAASSHHDVVQAALDALPRSLPERGLGPTQALSLILRNVVPALAQGQSGPRYFGFITGGTLPSSQLADFLTTIYDQNVGSNRTEESIAAVIESHALEFVLDLFDLPRDRFPARTLTTGGTAANVLGLALARDHAVRHALASPTHSVSEDGFGGVTVKVYTDRPHASLLKAAAIVGIGRANVVDLGKPIGGGGGGGGGSSDVIGIDLDELEQHLRDAAPGSGSGTAPVVSLSFGEVNTGDFTPNIGEIRALCDKYNVWLHIDAAFGAYARLVPDLVGPLANGLELADSIASDAHKWLNVPYDCGLFFSRSIAHQSSVFGPSPARPPPAYLARTPLPPAGTPGGTAAVRRSPALAAALGIADPMTMGIENSRRFRALPLYAALLDQGRAGYAGIVRRNVLFARRLAAWMGSPAGKGYYEVLNLRRSSAVGGGGGGGGGDGDGEGDGGGDGGRAGMTTPLNMLLFRAAAASNPVGGYVGAGGAALLVRAINETRKVQVTAGGTAAEAGAVRIAVSNWCTGLGEGEGEGDGKGDDGEGTEMGDFDFEIVVEVLLGVVERPPAWIQALAATAGGGP